ncbi:hypothetical protein GGS20DRAFT_590164 [Poronia punctata]|nr:hypothetical protein GGS20DRAFT_590164 [Poronia punctata]
MSALKAWSISYLPPIAHLLHWGSSERLADDDAKGLLAEDPLSIPLEDRISSVGPRPLPSHEKHRFRLPSFLRPNKGFLVLMGASVISLLFLALLATATETVEPLKGLLLCGNQRYYVSNQTCYNDDFLCPVKDRQRTLKCGDDCYLPRESYCDSGHVKFRAGGSLESQKPPIVGGSENGSCPLSYLHLTDRPYENYFVSDCSSATQVVVTSPVADSGLRLVDPRLLIAWPAGNSGIVTYFLSEEGSDAGLGISLEEIPGRNRTVSPLVGGVTGIISFNSSAVLDLAVIGSVRTLRDYVEGNSLNPIFQDSVRVQQLADDTIQLSRLWLDNVTETFLTLQPRDNESTRIKDGKAHLARGAYLFNAWHNYPELEQLSASETLNPDSQDLITQNPDETASLSFFSFTTKVVAGGWRFLTYFGRDSLISLLLLQPVLSLGEDGAVEAILSAAIERINSSDGSVCHEEVIGDYATFLNEQQGAYSSDALCDYKMVDTDFFLPIALEKYLVGSAVGKDRRGPFLARNASVIAENKDFTYAELALTTLEKIMRTTAAFEESPEVSNLIRLREGQSVGQWRDSGTGLGGGLVPYDVNTALVPAALRAIASLTADGLFPSHSDWAETALTRAQVWEDNTLPFFEVEIPADEARDLVSSYATQSEFPGAVNTSALTSPVRFYALSLEANDHPIVKVMNTDDCFRLYLLNPTNQTQLSTFLAQVADNILRPFPLGLSTSVGLLIANPAYADGSVNIADFKTSSYHGLVVWSWQLSMMAAGLERQLARCDDDDDDDGDKPDFCTDSPLHGRVVKAYNHLWDIIEQNSEYLSSEVWSWIYKDGDYVYTPLGALPGQDSSAESDIRQLWSLTFLAVKRNSAYSTLKNLT